MKYKLLLVFLLFLFGFMNSMVYGIENTIYLDWTPEWVVTDKQVWVEHADNIGTRLTKKDFTYSTLFTNANIGWFGRFDNNFSLIVNFNASLLSNYEGKLPESFPKSLTLFNIGFGGGYFWKNLIFYATPSFSLINNSLDFRGALGAKAYLPFNEWGLSIGFEINKPFYRFDNDLLFEPKMAIRTGIGIMYNLTNKKQIEMKAKEAEIKKQEQARIQEKKRLMDLEEKKKAHIKMLEDKGITEEEWQAQEKENERQAIILRVREENERNALSKLIQNLIDVGYNIGEPFNLGEIVSIPYGLFRVIDYSYSNGVHSYLVIMNDPNTPSKPFYIETKLPLNSIKAMRIQYVGIAQYLDNRVPRNSLNFKQIE